MNELFCIECGKMVHVEEGLVFGHVVFIPVYDSWEGLMGVDVDLCEFPSGYAFVPPPADLPEGWQDEMVEPGEDVIEPGVEVLLPELVEVG